MGIQSLCTMPQLSTRVHVHVYLSEKGRYSPHYVLHTLETTTVVQIGPKLMHWYGQHHIGVKNPWLRLREIGGIW